MQFAICFWIVELGSPVSKVPGVSTTTIFLLNRFADLAIHELVTELPESFDLNFSFPRLRDRKHNSLNKNHIQPQTMEDSFYHMLQHHFYLYINFM